jgi:hypothetical protein
MANQITAYVRNGSAGDNYVVTVLDLFGGGAREVNGSPFSFNPGETSPGFLVFADDSGAATIRCQGPNLQPSDNQVANDDQHNTVTIP